MLKVKWDRFLAIAIVALLSTTAGFAADSNQVQDWEQEAKELREKAKKKQEEAKRKKNMAKKLRKAAENYASQAKDAQKKVGEARQKWVKNFKKAIKGELPDTTPKVSDLRKMIRIDRQQAEQLMQNNDLKKLHGNFKEWYNLGKDFQRWGNHDSAIQAYQKALTKGGGRSVEYADICLRWAKSERKTGNPAEAAKPLNILLRRFGDIRSYGVQAQKRLCDIYYPDGEQGNRKKYMAEVHRFLRRYPDQSEANVELKRMQQLAEETGDITGVIQSLDREIQQAKSEHEREELSIARAKTLYGAKRYKDALRTLSQFPPSNTEAAILRARCAWKLLDYYAALEYLKHARETANYGKSPATTPPLDFLLSMSQFKSSQHEYGEAYDLLDHARDLLGASLTEEQKVKLKIARIDVMIAQGDTNSALPLIKELQTEYQGESPYWIGEVELAKIDFLRERYDEALKRLKQVAKLKDPSSSPRALFWIGKIQLQREESDKAIKTFRNLWSRYGANDLIIQAVYLIGKMYREKGEFVGAIRLFESVGLMRAAHRTKVVPGEEVALKVNDPDYAVGTGRDRMNVEVTTTSGDTENVSLKLNPVSNGLYAGAIRTKMAKPEPDSGTLEVLGDDVITVRYLDRFGAMEVQYQGSEVDMSQDQARPDTNISTHPGTKLFSDGKVKNLSRLADKNTEEPCQGFLDPQKNDSYTIGMRFLVKHRLKRVRIHTGEKAPRKIRIETLKLGDAEKKPENQEWVTRKKVDDLRGKGWHEYKFPPTESRGIRIRVLDHRRARGWRHINELEVIEGAPELSWQEADIKVEEATEKTFELLVVGDGNLRLSSTGFEEESEEGEESDLKKWLGTLPEETKEEENALDIDVSRREPGVITPGNTAFAQLTDMDLNVSPKIDTPTVEAIAYETTEEGEKKDILDTCPVELRETGPQTGVFRALVKTQPAGPTATASDTAEGYTPGAAINRDASADSCWQGTPDNAPGKWIKIDLKDLYNIAEISWTRGKKADDRIIKQGKVEIFGGVEDRSIPINNEDMTNPNTIKLEEPVRARYVRIVANDYSDSAPAIAQITLKDAEGNTIVPASVTPKEMRNNKVVDLDVGNTISLRYIDEENVDPGRPITRQSGTLDVKYDDADVRITASQKIEEGQEEKTEYRETLRLKPRQKFQAMVQDVDKDTNDKVQNVTVKVHSESGNTLELTAKETSGDSGTFVVNIHTRDKTAKQKSKSPKDNQKPEDTGAKSRDARPSRGPAPGKARGPGAFAGDKDGKNAGKRGPGGPGGPFAGKGRPKKGKENGKNKSARSDKEKSKPKNILYIKEGDAVWVNYVDEENLNPGNTVTRTAIAFVTPPTSGGFVYRSSEQGQQSDNSKGLASDLEKSDLVVPIPEFVQSEEEALPSLSFTVHDPDAATSPFASVPTYLGTRNTKQRRIRAVMPSTLSGDMSGTTSLTHRKTDSMWSKKSPILNKPLFNQKDVGRWKGNRPEEPTPLSLLGSDVVILQYLDRHGSAVDRKTVNVLSRSDVQSIKEETERSIPQPGSTVFMDHAPVIQLTDPETAIERRENKVKNLYDYLMGRRRKMYESMLEHLEKQRIELSTRLRVAKTRLKEKEGEGGKETGDKPDAAKLPEEATLEDEGASETEDILTTTERLSQKIKNIEEDIKKTKQQVDFFEKFEIPDEGDLPVLMREADSEDEGGRRSQETGPYFPGPVPAYRFKVRVDDPELLEKEGEAVVVIRSYLHEKEGTIEKKATPVTITDEETGEEKTVLQAVFKAARIGEEGDLPVGWNGTLRVSYKDPIEDAPESQLRKSFVSFASDGQMGITKDNFVDPPESRRVGEPLYLVVKDGDRDVSFTRDNVLVNVKSSTGDNVITSLAETTARSGIFRGKVNTAHGKKNTEDIKLQCEYGGSVTAEYIDYVNLGGEKDPSIYDLPSEREQKAFGEEKPESCVTVTAETNSEGIRVIKAEASLLSGSDGSVTLFARNLPRGRLEKETYFSSGYANYMLGKNFSELDLEDRAEETFAKAKDQFQSLIRDYPDQKEVAHATFYLGNVEFVQDNYEEAIRHYKNVLASTTKSEFVPKTRLRMGMSYEKLKRPRRAMEQYAYLTYHHSDSPYVKDAMANLIMHFDEMGQKAEKAGKIEKRNEAYARMVNVAEKFLNDYPDDKLTPKVILRSALRLVKSGQYARADEILQQAEEEHAGDSRYMPAYLYWHAEALIKGGLGEDSEERAKVLLQRVVYDFASSKYRRYAEARLEELEG